MASDSKMWMIKKSLFVELVAEKFWVILSFKEIVKHNLVPEILIFLGDHLEMVRKEITVTMCVSRTNRFGFLRHRRSHHHHGGCHYCCCLLELNDLTCFAHLVVLLLLSKMGETSQDNALEVTCMATQLNGLPSGWKACVVCVRIGVAFAVESIKQSLSLNFSLSQTSLLVLFSFAWLACRQLLNVSLFPAPATFSGCSILKQPPRH